jgi:hypothetical protein
VRSSVVLLAIAACGFERRALEVDAPTAEAPPEAAIDAAPAACPMAPPGCTAFGCAGSTSCYFLCSAGVPWPMANQRCMMAGVGCLATIDDAAENTCITAAAATSLPVWIGYVQTDTTTEPGVGWTWACRSSPFTPSPPWGVPGAEPNNAGGDEDCAEIVNAAGQWNDDECDDSLRFVCELPR